MQVENFEEKVPGKVTVKNTRESWDLRQALDPNQY